MVRERLRSFTTGDVAAHCGVVPQTAYNWVKSGKLKSHTTAGGHCRVLAADLQQFLREHGLPLLPEPEEPVRTRTVLVVDDEPEVAQISGKVLAKLGDYEVRLATSGFEAGVEVLRSKPDLIILDLFMPELDGFNVCRRLKSDAETRDIPILATTASPTQEIQEKIAACGADGFLAKPFLMEELTEAIEAVLAVGKGRCVRRKGA